MNNEQLHKFWDTPGGTIYEIAIGNSYDGGEQGKEDCRIADNLSHWLKRRITSNKQMVFVSVSTVLTRDISIALIRQGIADIVENVYILNRNTGKYMPRWRK